jgi:acyl carrier protein
MSEFANSEKRASPSFKMAIRYCIYGGRSEEQVLNHLPNHFSSSNVYSSAGKPLRINLSKRFGIGKLSDDVPPSHRHFEAALPDNQHLISEPIPCKRVAITAYTVETVLRNLPGVDDVALRWRPDESLDAYVSVAPQSKLVVRDITTFISLLIPGYAIPSHMYLIRGPLVRDLSGRYNYDRMERQALDNETIELDKRQLLVRDIFANILGVDLTYMRKDSDFFLLGGNSLLLGKLSYHLRRELGVNIGVADLFCESTIQGIATLVEEKGGSSTDHCTDDTTTPANSSSTVLSTDYDFENDPEYAGKRRGRSQVHPLCLVVQAIPFIVFYPFKTAFTCTSTLVFAISVSSRTMD